MAHSISANQNYPDRICDEPVIVPHQSENGSGRPAQCQPQMVDQDSIPSRKWASGMAGSRRSSHSVVAIDGDCSDDVADIYNQAGDDYVSYADGDPSQPFAFDGLHGHADRGVWAV